MPAIDPLLEHLGTSAAIRHVGSAHGSTVWRCWGSGPPLVLLHGGSGSWRHWARNIEPLAQVRQLWVPDLPGMGESAPLPEGADRGDVAQVVLDGAQALLGDTPFDLAGFSFGGSVAALAVALRPPAMRSLTLIGPGGFGQLVRDPPAVRIMGLIGSEREAAHRQNLSAMMIADPQRIDALALEIQEQNTRYRGRRIGGRRQPILPDALLSFRGQLNIAWGSQDQYAENTLPDRVALMQAARPDADIKLFDGAGHWVMYEAAAAFNAYCVARLG